MNKKTLVLGASLNEDRYSNIAIQRMVHSSLEVVAIGLVSGMVAGVSIKTGYPEIEDVHTITIYLNPKRQVIYYNYIISLKPKRVIFNPGTENTELMKLLRKNNIKVEVACTLVLLSTDQY
ncbi:MAG: CoA-binding protein [Flavobacteriaceae bacterium]|nr:CoA-binding protein [Flavobacteriaceae bacterium]